MFLLGVILGSIYCLLSLWFYIGENTKLNKCLNVIFVVIILVIGLW